MDLSPTVENAASSRSTSDGSTAGAPVPTSPDRLVARAGRRHRQPDPPRSPSPTEAADAAGRASASPRLSPFAHLAMRPSLAADAGRLPSPGVAHRTTTFFGGYEFRDEDNALLQEALAATSNSLARAAAAAASATADSDSDAEADEHAGGRFHRVASDDYDADYADRDEDAVYRRRVAEDAVAPLGTSRGSRRTAASEPMC